MPASFSLTGVCIDSHVAGSTLPATLGRETKGAMDVRFGFTVWPVAKAERGEWLGVTALVHAPTGDYDNRQTLNSGENRWKGSLNIGWVYALTSEVSLDVTPEVVVYGANTDYLSGGRLTQKPSYAVTSYLRWQPTKTWAMFAGIQGNGGGETTINGVRQNNRPMNTRGLVGVMAQPTPSTVLMLRYGQDQDVTNGFALRDEWAFRASFRF